MPQEASDRRRVLRMVMLAVLVWGSVLALGATLYGVDMSTGEVHFAPNLVRGAIVEACVLAFLGIWMLALRQSAKR